MQFKPGTVLAFMGNVEDLIVVIGFKGDFVICYDIITEEVRSFYHEFMQRCFQYL